MPLNPIPVGSEFLVNTYTTSNQTNPSITAVNGGRFVVTWVSDGQDGSQFGVFGQRFDSSGTPIGAEFQVNTYTANFQEGPSVTALSNGGFVVTWFSGGQDGDLTGIFGQRYDASGAPDGAEFQVNTHTTGNQNHPSVTALNNGGFVVTWESYAQDGSIFGIFGQRYDAAGAPAGPEFQVNTETISSQLFPSTSALSDGGFVVTWASFNQDGDNYGIFGQRFDAAGAAVGAEFQINTHTMNLQYDPSVTGLSDGGFVVIWESDLQDGSNVGVYGQRYDASGVVSGAEFQVNTYVTSYQNDPSVAALHDGGFIVTWESLSQDGSSNGIFGQRYDASGAVVGAEIQINTFTTNPQSDPSVTVLSDGAFVVTWETLGQDGDGYGIYAQQYAAQLFGTSSGDIIEDTVGAGWMNGQGGGDTLKGLGGKDTIYGGGGADTLSGGASKDYLYGQGGKDTLKGGNGNDLLDGGAKNDKMTGGGGKDKFVFKLGYGKDKVTDFKDDIDTLQLSETLWGGGLTKQQVINTYASVDGSDIVFDFGADQLRLKGFTDMIELKDDMAFI